MTSVEAGGGVPGGGREEHVARTGGALGARVPTGGLQPGKCEPSLQPAGPLRREPSLERQEVGIPMSLSTPGQTIFTSKLAGKGKP